MTKEFNTALELAREADRRDYLAWKAEKGKKRETTESKMLTEVQSKGSIIRLKVGAGSDGNYHFEIHESEDSQAYYHRPDDSTRDLGPLYFAELTDEEKRVSVKEGWFDDRD